MIQFKYTPWKPTFADASDPSPVKELTMTLSDSVAWEEAVCEFHNFLRAAGYVIPYDLEWYEDEDDLCTPLQKLTDWEEKYRPDMHRNTMQNEGDAN